jgi:ribosomal protein S1
VSKTTTEEPSIENNEAVAILEAVNSVNDTSGDIPPIDAAIIPDGTESDEEDLDVETETDGEEESEEEQLRALIKQILNKKNAKAGDKLSKSQKKKMYNSEKVTGKTFESEAKTQSDMQADEARLLREAMEAVPNRRTLEGTIVGCIENNVGICAIIKIKDTSGFFKIFCPVSHLFVYDKSKYEGDAGNRNLEKKIENRINSKVRFKVKYINEEERFAYVSRIEAMAEDTKSTYLNIKPGEEKPRYVEGMIVEASITETRRNGLYVEVNGAETYIKGEDLSWTRMREVNEEMHVGAKINVKLKKITPMEYGNNEAIYKMVNIEASIREATKDPKEIFYDQFELGEKCLAEVKQVSTDGKAVFVSLGPGKMDAICFIPRFGTPKRGDMVAVQITEKKDAEKRISAIIKRIL